LQESALADTDVERRAWLASRGLEGVPRLVEQLRVEPGWEQAVEIRLGPALRAVAVEALESVVADADDLPPGLVLLETANTGIAADVNPQAGFTGYWRLGRRAQSPWPIGRLLGPAHTVARLSEALTARDDTGAGRVPGHA
jgi:chromosome segregation protein